MTGIYKIENTVNGKVYIGQSKNIEERWKSHIRASKSKASVGYNYYIHKAFRKYGIENFIFSVVEECEPSELNEREVYWIKIYESVNNEHGYNMTEGGDNTSYHAQRPIYQIDIDTKEIVNKYKSCFEAGRCIGKFQANIRHCCDKKYRYAYGFLWVYADEYDPNEIKKRNISINLSAHSGKSKEVAKCDKNTHDVLEIFVNSKEASEKTGITRSAISNCLVNISKSAGGYYWAYTENIKGVLN